MNFFMSRIRRFRDQEDGVISIELLFAVPILVWALMSTMVYFDAYRAESISNRAALTVADMFSREEAAISPAFLDGTQQVLQLLAEARTLPEFRVTTFSYDETADAFERRWSENRSVGDNLDNNDLANMRDRFPRMADNDRAILLETWTDYTPPMRVGLWLFRSSDAQTTNIEFKTFTVIKPRYTNNFCFDKTPLVTTNGDEEC